MSNNSLQKDSSLIGVISDTHGLLRPSAIQALKGSDLIIHAGDIGNDQVLESLSTIAPVVAVRGNVDWDIRANELPVSEVVEIGKISLYVLHDLHNLDLDPTAAGFSVIVSGHSHRPSFEKKKEVHFLNPGSAGPRRFKLPITLARLKLQGNSLDAEFIEL